MNALAKPAAAIAAPVLISIGKIEPSPTNPRKTFDKTKLAELAESITAHGLLSPPLVRPKDGDAKANGYELVHGERRWRAYQLLATPEMPCFVEDLDDTQVIEIQVIENGQREDVPPLEEAEGYALLLKQPGYTMDRLVEKTGKSRAHLYGRLKIANDLCPRAKKALADGVLSASVAELLARLPDKKIQDLATRDVLGEQLPYNQEFPSTDSRRTVEHERFAANDSADYAHREETSTALSFRAAQALLHRRYSLRLDQAKFDTSDVELVKDVGACGTCEYRSGNAPDLFGALTNPADVCTNPPCFEKKTAAAFKAAAAIAKAAKRPVLAGKDAEALFEKHGGLKYNSEYINPDSDLPYELRKGNSPTSPSWKKLLGAAHAVPIVLVEDPRTGAPLELMKKSDAVAALKAAGKIDKPSKPSPAASKAKKEERAEKAKAKSKLEIKEGAFVRILGDLAEKAAAVDVAGGKKLVPILRWLARFVAEASSYNGGERVVERRALPGGGDPGTKLEKVIDRASGGDLLGLLVELIAASYEGTVLGINGDKGRMQMFADVCELLGADWAKAQDLAKVALAAEDKSAKAKAKKGSAK